jgi:hypothetical protein
MNESGVYKRFPAPRRRACVPVTSTRPSGTERSQQTRAAGQASGEGPLPRGAVLRRSI